MMRIRKQSVLCLSCQAHGEVELVMNAPADIYLASMRAARCPSCGGKKLVLTCPACQEEK